MYILKIYTRKLLCVMIGLFCTSVGFSQSILTLNECYDLARKVHPEYANSDVFNEQARLDKMNISTAYLPDISLGAEAKYLSDVTSVGMSNVETPAQDQYKTYLDVKQLIYDGGANKASRQISEVDRLVSNLQNEINLYSTKEIVNNFFFSILLLNKNIVVVKSTLNLLNKDEEVMDSRMKNGIITSGDLYKIQAEILKFKQKKVELTYMRSSIIKSFGEYTNSEVNDSTQFVVEEISVVNKLNISRPELKLFSYQQDRIDASINQLQSVLLPKIFAFGQLGYGQPGLNMMESDFNSYYTVGVGLKWKVFDWKKTSRKKQIMSMQKEIIDTRSQTFVKNIKTAIHQVVGEMDKCKTLIEYDHQLVSAYTDICKQSSSRLRNGIINTSDYLKDVNQLLEYEQTKEYHIVELLKYKANYNYIIGY